MNRECPWPHPLEQGVYGTPRKTQTQRVQAALQTSGIEMKNHRSKISLLTMSLILTACGGGGGDSPAVAAPGTTVAPSTPVASSSPLARDFPSIEDCISTEWILVADQATRAANATVAPGVTILTTGQASVNIARDGTYTYSPRFTVNMQTPAGPASGQASGSSRGTWSISGNTLVTRETSNNITGVATGSFGSVPLPPITGFSSMSSTILACNPSYFEYEVTSSTGNFTQRLVR